MIVRKYFTTDAKYKGKEYTREWVGFFLFGFIPLYIREYMVGRD